MIITRQSPRGGHPLKQYGDFHYVSGGRGGLKIGYAPQDAEFKPGEPILIPMDEVDKFVKDFAYTVKFPRWWRVVIPRR